MSDDKYEYGVVSECCGCPVVYLDICECCGEHCDVVPEEDEEE